MDDLKFKTYSQFNQFKEDTEKGILYIEGYASKFLDKNRPVVDYDGEIVDVSGFDLSTCTTLLFNHDSDEYAVGKCRLEHRPDGAYLFGEIHREMNDKVYYAVKHGIMTDFSIGFVASDYKYQKIDGEDVLTFTKGFVFETSIVNVIGANPLAKIEATKSLKKDKQLREIATWLQSSSNVRLDKPTEIKSIKTEDGCIGFSCSIEQLKKANPEGNCSCNQVENKGKEMNEENIEKTNIKNIIKGLTFEETENERWSQDRKLSYYIGVLIDTIHDNFYESMWQDDMSPEDYKQNIIDTLTTFAEKLDEFSVLDKPTNVDITKNQRENENMKTKSVEESTQENQAETLEGQEEETPAIVDETPEQEKESETVETSEENVEVTETPSDNATEETPVEESNLQPKPISTNEIIGALNTISLDKLSEEEIEALYDTASAQMEKIEAYVRQVLAQGDGEE